MDDTKQEPKVITLVRNDHIVYPSTYADYELLTQIGAPFRLMESTFLPVLRDLAKSASVKMKIVEFETIEEEMFVKLKVKWPGSVLQKRNSFKLSGEREISDKKIANVLSNLRRWYRENFFVLDVEQNSSRKGVTILCQKRLNV